MVLSHHSSLSVVVTLCPSWTSESIVEGPFLVDISALSPQSQEKDPSFAPAQVDLPHWEEVTIQTQSHGGHSVQKDKVTPYGVGQIPSLYSQHG